MIPIFITGQNNKTAPELLKKLESAGIPQAKPHHRDTQLTLSTWHQKVAQKGHTQPGRVWEQMATELLVANIDQPQWAWADTNLLPFLDYWATFDESIRFVLLAESPVHIALSEQEGIDVQALLQGWVQVHQVLLNFSLRHPQRCLLVWGHEARQHLDTLCEQLNLRWGIDFQRKEQSEQSGAPCQLGDHLAEQMCLTHPQAHQLLADLKACVLPLSPTSNDTQIPAMLSRYRELIENRQAQKQIQDLEKELQSQIQSLQEAHNQLQHAEAQRQEAQAQALKAQELTQQAQQQAKQAEAKAATAERSRIEAESRTKQAQEQSKQAETKAIAAEKAKVIAETQAQQANTRTKEAIAKAAGAEQALLVAQENLEKLQSQHKETAEEAELLLNQLHVVQEELENYYYRNKELQNQTENLSQLQQRWHTLFAQNRELYAVQTVRLERLPESAQAYACQLEQLDIAGRHFDNLSLQLQLQNDGCAALSLQRPEQGDGPLLRWPSDIRPGHSLMLHPATESDTSANKVAAFMQLSSTDWQLVENLPRLLLAALPKITALDDIEKQALTSALQRYVEELKVFAGLLHFDNAVCPTPPSADQLTLDLNFVVHQRLQADSVQLNLQRLEGGVFELQLSPNTITGDQGRQLQITPQGWLEGQAQCTEAQHQRLKLLVANLPLALADAARQGADKNCLKAWAKVTRLLRDGLDNRATQDSATAPGPTTARQAKAKVAPTSKTKITTSTKKPKQSQARPQTQAVKTANVASKVPPGPAAPASAKHPVKTRRKTRA